MFNRDQSTIRHHCHQAGLKNFIGNGKLFKYQKEKIIKDFKKPFSMTFYKKPRAKKYLDYVAEYLQREKKNYGEESVKKYVKNNSTNIFLDNMYDKIFDKQCGENN